MTLNAPAEITVGSPIPWSFESPTRVVGRVRLTSGTDLLTFRLEGSVRSDPRSTHRIRGKSGSYQIVGWGDHPPGTELVLRFEGAKVWMTVTG